MSTYKKCHLVITFLLSFVSTLCFGATQFAAPASDDLFESEVEGVLRIRPVGDIEGKGVHFEALVNEGLIKWDALKRRWDLTKFDTIILCNGDFMRRGPFGRRAMEAAIDLQKRYPKFVKISLGNHDGNILSYLVVRAELDSKIPTNIRSEYDQWLHKNGVQDSRANQLFFWGRKMGVNDKVENFWLEEVLIKLGAQPNETESPLTERFYDSKGKLDYQKLAQVIPAEEMATRFYDFVRPGGVENGNWRLLEIAKLAGAIVDRIDGKRTIIEYSHSGMDSIDNYGVVPTISDKYVQINGKQNLANNPKRGMNPHKPNDFAYYLQGLRDLDRDFKLAQLNGIKATLGQISALHENETERLKELVESLRKFELVYNVDSLWSDATGSYYRSDSRVYPDPRQIKDNSLPPISSPEILTAKARIGVVGSAGGHRAIGDIAAVMTGYDPVTETEISDLRHDTSYSPVEGNNTPEMWTNGAVRVSGRTRDGVEVVIEKPGNNTTKKWRALEKEWKQKVSQAKERGETLEIPADIKKKIDRLERYSRLGKVAGGRLVMGFVRKMQGDKLVTDYDEYMTVRQVGRDFIYQQIDIWGLMEYEQKTGPLEYAHADLTEMLKNTEKEKSEGLKKLGRTVLTEGEFMTALEGKTVISASGPAANYAQVLQDPTAAEYINKKSLPAWKEQLLNIPGSEEVVLLVGGTEGWEAEKTKIAAQVNEIRRSKGQTQIRIIGAAALVFGLGEIDPSVREFFLIPDTFYWNDYLPNLMENHVLKSRAKSIHFDFAGGGGIVGDQILLAVKWAENDPRITTTLEKGITVVPGDTTHKKRGASDKFADKVMSGNASGGRALSVVEATPIGFKTVFGPTSVRTKLSRYAQNPLAPSAKISNQRGQESSRRDGTARTSCRLIVK